jgi:hypothetical protein
MSEIKVNKISPKQTCTQLTLGDSGDTIIIPAGATIQNSGTATGFGATGAVNWDTTPKTTTVTAVSGNGYFVNTTAGAITVNLPAGVAGSIVAVSDYANTAATNNITINSNGTDKINGVDGDAKITTNGASITLIYVDSTRGWKDINDATLDVTGIPPFVAATGGTITTSGDYKIHTFTGPGTFTVTSAGTPAGSTTVDYLVVAGGAAGGANGSPNIWGGGGGGAGGYRESSGTASGSYTVSPLGSGVPALPVSVTGYPITVGAGGASSASPVAGPSGSNSIFSTITSAGGGGGGTQALAPSTINGQPGGSGGGGGATGSGGTGNTPPVSPSQGNNGGTASSPSGSSGGGGGATAAGGNAPTPAGGAGGAGATSSINGTPTARAGGGGGGVYGSGLPGPGGAGGGGSGGPCGPGQGVDGTANTGGGGGGNSQKPAPYPTTGGGSGGSGIVIVRYKYQ